MSEMTRARAIPSLQFNVAQLLKQQTGARRQYDVYVESPNIEDGLVLAAPLSGRVHLVRVGEGILVTGEMETIARLKCSRCLSEFDYAVAIELEEEYEPVVDIATGSHRSLSEDQDSANLIDEHHILDITEVVRQDLWVALPPSLLCSEDCKGLCPQCGQNLNQGSCSCVSEEIDPRWSALFESSSEVSE
jgi:uncharacterized protein